MSSRRREKNGGASYIGSLGRGVRRLWGAFRDKLERLVLKGQQKFTIMLIPHSESRVVNFSISSFTMVFIGVIVGIVLTVFLVFSARFTGVSGLLDEKTTRLDAAEGNLELLLDDISELRDVSQPFQASLERIMGNLNLGYDTDEINPVGVGDLGSFLLIEKQEQGVLAELSELKSLGSTMENSIEVLEKISQSLVSQRELLVEMPTMWPVDGGDGRITQRFGPSENPFTREWYLHKGLDIAYGYGKPIVAAANGKVVERKYDALGFGNYIMIRHNFGFQTVYAHLQNVYVDEGDTVEQGDVIATMGNTGMSTGPHLHLEIRIGTQGVDPHRFLGVGRQLH